jgi:SAM-dependent methyltransferase
MSSRGRRNQKVSAAYERLVEAGVFTTEFEHAAVQRELFFRVMSVEVERLADRSDAAILEVGCGAGAWIEELSRIASGRIPSVRWFGFDLTPAMVSVAAQRLSGVVDGVVLAAGDVLDADSYNLRPGGRYELIYAYDVVQQLPRRDQSEAIETLLWHVAPGGTLVIFDHEAHSVYGVLMDARKRLSRLGVPLVPSYYLTVRYPRLERIRRFLARRDGIEAQIVTASDRRKRALIVRLTPQEMQQ